MSANTNINDISRSVDQFLNGGGGVTSTQVEGQPVEIGVPSVDVGEVSFDASAARHVEQVQSEQPSYVGQGFNLDEAAVAGMSGLSPQPVETARQMPVETARQMQSQDDGIRQSVQNASSMAPSQDAHVQSGMASQGPVGEIPYVDLPEGSLPIQSKRERTGSVYDAAESGNRLANIGIRNEANRYFDSLDSVEAGEDGERDVSGETSQAMAYQASRLSNSADRAISADMSEIESSDGGKPPWWLNPVDRLVRFSQNYEARPKKIIDAIKNRTARAFKQEGVGNRIYGKMLGYSKLEFDEVGVGIQEIMAIVQQDPSQLESLLSQRVGGDLPALPMMSSADIAKLINDSEIWVATFKPPNNQGQDIQRRKLRVLTDQQRGLFLHNIQAAMYTADYDGDDMEISFDPEVARYAKNPMDYMVDIFGKISLNSDFLPVARIVGVNGMTAEEYVRDVILRDFSRLNEERSNRTDDKTHIETNVNYGNIAPLVKAVLNLGETQDKSQDAQEDAWRDLFYEARRFSDKMARGKSGSDSMMAKICRAVFESMRQTKYYNTLTTIGGDIVVLSSGMVPKPVTYADAALYKVIDGIVRGSAPNNFQELKLMLTGFVGNVAKKNAPFRFTADVGKMVKMDERLKVGDGYTLDVNDDQQMELFFRTTLKYAGSLKMAKEIKKAGRSEFYTQVMRKMVIDEVGFPDDPRYQGSFQRFMETFVDAYNYHSATINESNLVFLTNMGLGTESNGIVSAISKTGTDRQGRIVDYTLGDVAEPILSIYGNYSVGRFFNRLTDAGIMTRGRRDPRWYGNPNSSGHKHVIEREYDNRFRVTNSGWENGFWITGKYIDYNLTQFRNENRLITGAKYEGDELDRTQIQVARSRKIGDLSSIKESADSDIDAQFELLMAIADKKTGAMSKFNISTYGDVEGGHSSNEKTTVRYMSTLLTSVQKAMREGNTVLAPGFYAGIGQRKDLPPEVKNHMINLAKRLRQMDFVLRSGDAVESDQSFQLGAGSDAVIYKSNSRAELSNTTSGTRVNFDEMTESQRKDALDAVVRLHPNGESITGETRDLMARNYYQVIGTDGQPNSAFIACYADGSSRGTWQAIRLARENGIPVFNAAEYDDYKQWEDDVVEAATKANNGELRSDLVGSSQALEIDEAISALIMANPDLFMHFNMDSTGAFLSSSYGKKMLQYADNPEMLGGIYTSMVFDFRMERINSLTSEFLSAQTTERLEESWNDLLLAKDELSASSEVWHGIIREFEAAATPGMKSYFQMMREYTAYGQKENLPKQYVMNAKTGEWVSYGWDAIRDAEKFWWNDTTHNSLRSVIEDLDIDRDTKWNIITDVVRYWERDGNLKTYEVGYQLEIGNDSSYTVGGAPGKAVMRTHNDFQEAFGRWAKRSQTRLREDVERAHITHRHDGALSKTLQRLDEEPWTLVAIDSLMYADAILSVYDKTYAQTEKASQNPWTNAIYAALSHQQVGGYMNDVTRTDDRLLGLTAADSVTIHDIVHLLANPGEEMTIYGKGGEWGVISRDILLEAELGQLSGDTEADLWAFLSKQPRIASAIRKHSACVLQDSDGTGYLGASCSISETLDSLSKGKRDPLEHAKYLMRDHPGYAGIISLALPGKNLITRNARHRIRQIEDYLSYELYAAASATEWSEEDAASIILGDLGITQESLRAAMRSDYDTFLERQGLDAYKYAVTDKDGNRILESEHDADLTYEYAFNRIAEYIRELRDPRNKVVLGQFVQQPEEPDFDSSIGPDAVSAAAFWDTIQELSGAKTAVSTGIEGNETYKFAEWASHIHARDGYANLETLGDTNEIDTMLGRSWLPDEQWDGAWTSLTNLDGSPVYLSTGVSGASSETGWDGGTQHRTWSSSDGVRLEMTVLNDDNEPETRTYYLNPTGTDLSFADARADASRHMKMKIDEIVIKVPDGVTLNDRSTDTHGTQVASLFAYLVSKRSNGAEAFNLKAKKAGIDGKDSITKKLEGGKHKMQNGRYVSYLDVKLRLEAIARRNGIQAAQLELARMMRDENHELGYDDLSLANYMSIAELMLIEGQDGDICLRSLEMLMSAIKHRIGFGVDQMSDEELTEAVNSIVHDNSETGVGMAMLGTIEALDGFSQRSTAVQHNAIRQSSSVFARNYDLMSSISKNARDNGIDPLTREEIEEIDNRLSGIVFGDLEDPENKRGRELHKALNGYNFVSMVGYRQYPSAIDHAIDVAFEGSPIYDEDNWTIGPSNAMYVAWDGSAVDSETMRDHYDMAYYLGMTIVVESSAYDTIPDYMKKDAIPLLSQDNKSLGAAIIPCYDMRLNGSESTPLKARFAMAPVDFSQYVASAEDSTNEFGLGDAEGQALTSLTKRMSMVDNGSIQVKAEDLFRNVFTNERFKDCHFEVGLASGQEVRNLIADGVRCTIDYGAAEGSQGWDQHVKNVDAAIERYRERFKSANADGLIMGMDDCVPGDIVGWAECAITYWNGYTEYVLAPIIPFPLHGVKRQPSTYSIENLGPVDGDGSLFHVDWRNSTSLEDNFVKYFDSSGGANKGMISLSQALDESRTLLDGTQLDVYIAKASTDSRKVGTDRRIKTMITLMTLARMHGYNFARKNDGTPNEDAFPDSPELRERMIHERIPRSEWSQILDSGTRFVTDDTLNAFITYECRKVLNNDGNPSDYLANVYEDSTTGELSNTHMMWEFEAMFDQGLNYEDGLLRFLAFVNPIDKSSSHVEQFCPNGIEDTTSDALFRLYQENGKLGEGYDYGVLQMRVPHRLNNNMMAYVWDNVYIGMSFFGEEYSGFSRPNIDGASNFLDGMNTMSMYGTKMKGFSERKRAQWATSDISRLHGNGSYEKM